MRPFAKEFYLSKSWKSARDYVFKRDYGLCVRCSDSGHIVHHKIYLNPNNINNCNISLNPDNLELLCRSCHEIEHAGLCVTESGLKFNKEGELIDIKSIY